MGKQIEDFEFCVAHVGINCSNRQSAAKAADTFSNLFGFSVKDGNSSVFAGKEIELMKAPGYGSKGHLAVRTQYVEEAIEFLQQKGVMFIPESVLRNKDGDIVRIFLKDEIEGFAIHLLRA